MSRAASSINRCNNVQQLLQAINISIPQNKCNIGTNQLITWEKDSSNNKTSNKNDAYNDSPIDSIMKTLKSQRYSNTTSNYGCTVPCTNLLLSLGHSFSSLGWKNKFIWQYHRIDYDDDGEEEDDEEVDQDDYDYEDEEEEYDDSDSENDDADSIYHKDNVVKFRESSGREIHSPGSYEGKYEAIIQTLLRYQELYGDMLVPVLFIVPSTADWPALSWGKWLGKSVTKIRGRQIFKDKTAEFSSLGFDFTRRSLKKKNTVRGTISKPMTLENRGTNIKDGIKEKKKKGVKNIVDSSPGNRVRTVKKGRKLDESNFDFTVRMLVHYKELHGNMLVPSVFIIPWTDDWPEETWGKERCACFYLMV